MSGDLRAGIKARVFLELSVSQINTKTKFMCCKIIRKNSCEEWSISKVKGSFSVPFWALKEYMFDGDPNSALLIIDMRQICPILRSLGRKELLYDVFWADNSSEMNLKIKRKNFLFARGDGVLT